jgi:hypothetical protein
VHKILVGGVNWMIDPEVLIGAGECTSDLNVPHEEAGISGRAFADDASAVRFRSVVNPN